MGMEKPGLFRNSLNKFVPVPMQISTNQEDKPGVNE
jgi:hypothetical protein